ncbi:cyclin-dependent kinase 2-interacting protein-like [Phthorimaea operculella]|nr:cyclin-dependent kinase 2-interacting protein-like [Phthorimaea operculella]
MSQPPTSNNHQSPFPTHNFIPKELPSNKDVHGISRTVFTHISRLHGLLTDWVRIQDKGTKVCRAVSALKLHECKDDYYPQALKPLTESLVDALDSLKHIVEGVETIDRQLQALAKLQPTDEPVILTWSASRISETVTTIYKAVQKEYRLKEVITENIAHCRDENLIEVYVSSWEFDAYLKLQSNTAYLFAEVGLAGIT